MNKAELRKHPEYKKAMDKIESYPKDFTFEMNYKIMTKAQQNAMDVILQDAKKVGLIESISFNLNFDGDITAEVFKKL